MKYLIIIALFLSQTTRMQAQRVAYIDMDLILASVDEYKKAQTDLISLQKNGVGKLRENTVN